MGSTILWWRKSERKTQQVIHRHYTFTPDLGKIARLIDAERLPPGYELSLRRIFANSKHAEGLIKGEKLQKELPQLRSLDLDFYFRPGNRRLGGHGAIDLDFVEKTADIKCHGDWDWFGPILDRWALSLELRPAEQTLTKDFTAELQASLSADLFEVVKAPLGVGQYAVALTAAVVFVEDRLRRKLGPDAAGMTGSNLSVHAFKNPGLLTPPLAGAVGAEEGAFLILKGWFSLVRNLHGHQTAFAMSREEVRAQLFGCDYILWLIDNSVLK